MGAASCFCFLFSSLLYNGNRWSEKTKKVNLEKSLIKELEYDENFLNKIRTDINKIVEKVTVDDKEIYYTFVYITYFRSFTQSYFNEGYMFDKLEIDDLESINDILMHMSEGMQQYMNNSIQQWKDDTITRAILLSRLTFERDTIERYLKAIATIRKKITS